MLDDKDAGECDDDDDDEDTDEADDITLAESLSVPLKLPDDGFK